MATHNSTPARQVKSQRTHDRLRVMMLGSFPPQTQGIQEYCGAIASALAAHCDVTAFGFSKMYPPFLFPGVKHAMDTTRAVIEKPGLHIRNILTYYNPFNWLWRAVSTPCDVVHVQWWSLPLWPVAFIMIAAGRLRGKRVVVTLHNVLPHERQGAFVAATRILVRLAHDVIVHGKQNAADAAATYRIEPARLHEVPMGIFTGLAKIVPKNSARQAANIGSAAKVVLFFGIIRDYKGVDVLLEAAAKLRAQFPDLLVIVAGTPWADWSPYDAIIERNDMRGYTRLALHYVDAEDLGNYFCAADVVALPYKHFHAQSAVATTSLGFKVPTIVSRTGAMTECVDHNSNWIAEPGDADSLAQKLREFFENQPTREAEFAQVLARVTESMSWERIADQHVAIYRVRSVAS